MFGLMDFYYLLIIGSINPCCVCFALLSVAAFGDVSVLDMVCSDNLVGFGFGSDLFRWFFFF